MMQNSTLKIDEVLFPNKKRLAARAYYLGERIDLNAFEGSTHGPGVEFRKVGEGFAAIFRYGSVVFLGISQEGERAFLSELHPHVSAPLERAISESAVINVSVDAEHRLGRRSSGLDAIGGDLAIRKSTYGRLQILAEVLAKSIALQHFEERAARIFDRIEPLAREARNGRRSQDRQLINLLSDATVTLVHMAGRVEIRDKPDLAWDQPDLDRLYEKISVEYELRDRDVALTRKLELINQTTDTFFHISQARRTLRVEWYITILIVIEIFLGLMGVWG